MNDDRHEELGEDEEIDQLEVHNQIDELIKTPPGVDDVEVFPGDEIAPTLEHLPYQKRGKKAPYRALTIPERDMLFAFYEKWNGNMLAVSRDPECKIKAYNQIKYWSNLYGFPERLVHARTERAKETLASLNDAKLDAVRQASDMVRPRQIVLRGSKGDPILMNGEPVFVTQYPDHKTVKTAWEIIKTELGEPTWIAKSEVNTPMATEVREALDLISQLTQHGGARTSESNVQGQRGTAGDTAEVSPAVQHDPDQSTPAQ